jgi:hypothetical protein
MCSSKQFLLFKPAEFQQSSPAKATDIAMSVVNLPLRLPISRTFPSHGGIVAAARDKKRTSRIDSQPVRLSAKAFISSRSLSISDICKVSASGRDEIF